MSIDDSELHHLKLLLNEIFGEENCVATLVWERSRKNDAKLFSVGHEYMLIFAKNLQSLRERGLELRAPKEGLEELKALWHTLRERHGDDFPAIEQGLRKYYATFLDDDLRRPLARFRKVDAGGPYRDDADISWPGPGGPKYPVLHPITGKSCAVPERGWVFSTPERMAEAITAGEVAFGKDETTVPALLGLTVEYLSPEDETWQKVWLLYCMYDHDCRRDRYLKVFEGPAVSTSIAAPRATSAPLGQPAP